MNTYLKSISLFILLLLGSVVSYSQEYEIFALRFGNRLQALPVSEIAVGATGSDSVNTIYMFWLLQGYNERTVLVDAGFTADAATDPGQIQFTRPDSVLAVLNIMP